MTTVGIVGYDAVQIKEVLSARFPDVRFVTAERDDAFRDAEAEILISRGGGMHGLVDAGDIAALPRLAWVQSMVSGTDHWLAALAERPDVLLTSGRGIHGPSVSEMAIFHMLSLSRHARRLFRHQEQRLWDRTVEQDLLQGRTVGIVGLGVIGAYLARLCKAFGMTVYGLARKHREVPDVDEFFEAERLLELAARSDFLVLLIPLTDETRGLIDKRVLAAMKPTAYLLNFARGAVVDEDALIAALQNKTIAGAGLDAFVEETPRLPPHSRVWDFENVVITPHLAGESVRYARQILPIIESNLAAYRAGEPERLINIVPR